MSIAIMLLHLFLIEAYRPNNMPDVCAVESYVYRIVGHRSWQAYMGDGPDCAVCQSVLNQTPNIHLPLVITSDRIITVHGN